MWRSLVAAVLPLVACGSPLAEAPVVVCPVPTNEPPRPPAPTVAPAPPPLASAPPVALPHLDTPELDAQLAFANAVCDAAVQHDPNGHARVGCATCLREPIIVGAPRAAVAVDPATFYPLHMMVRGSFTRAGADEIAASFEGCEPHSSNWGGTVFVQASAPSHARYVSGLNPSACVPYRRADGRDILVCRAQDAHQGQGTDAVFAFDLARMLGDDLEKAWLGVVRMTDDAFEGCMGVRPNATKEPLTSGAVESFTLHDEDGDGRPELVVAVTQRRGRPSAGYQALCDKAFQEGNEGADAAVRAALGPARKTRLVFRYDGATFVPTPATAAALRKL